jgi:hypothetical protein
MTRLVKLAAELQLLLDEKSWKNCLIGGLVLQRWGEPRLTKGVDMTVLAGFGGEAPVVDLLLARFAGRRPDAREFALQNRVLLIQSADVFGRRPGGDEGVREPRARLAGCGNGVDPAGRAAGLAADHGRVEAVERIERVAGHSGAAGRTPPQSGGAEMNLK